MNGIRKPRGGGGVALARMALVASVLAPPVVARDHNGVANAGDAIEVARPAEQTPELVKPGVETGRAQIPPPSGLVRGHGGQTAEGAPAQGGRDLAAERAAVEKAVRASIGWALTKDRPLLESVIAHDAELFIFHPDSASTVVGWDSFAKNFAFWMDPRFKATSFDVRDLRITFSRGGDVAWFSAMLDDLAEWDGKPIGWKNTRWTGVVEKRDGRWVIVQMHFSFASDRAQADTAVPPVGKQAPAFPCST